MSNAKTDMTPEQRIDAALDSVLRASGASIHDCTTLSKLRMREVMRKVMQDSYIKGSNDSYEAMKKIGRDTKGELQ